MQKVGSLFRELAKYLYLNVSIYVRTVCPYLCAYTCRYTQKRASGPSEMELQELGAAQQEL